VPHNSAQTISTRALSATLHGGRTEFLESQLYSYTISAFSRTRNLGEIDLPALHLVLMLVVAAAALCCPMHL